jgi:uncharacterized protein (DUF2062 family)
VTLSFLKIWIARFRVSVQEHSPEQFALLVAVGMVLGVFPMIGLPTVFCILAAWGLRLNFVALQAINQIASPLQVILVLPLARVGAALCSTALPSHTSVAHKLSAAALNAIAGSVCICIPLGALTYVVLVLLMRRGRGICFNDVKSPA